ncbi:rhomboid family intramembrane serine protease [Luteolibacter yonseiensis]|uniref:Rhomboid family intramembrane serine protease n=1 Tax=Luteolibacter yonseiensis TaxID=1144680 RepID=A0A934R3Y2_9BACT|nr:rhomboid family intramembrane serine protease [Luteolibacter yonseiensis]MBK1816656.1 rhomboid family intramembrane serine protease [Luteolibacter yonseiensis]
MNEAHLENADAPVWAREDAFPEAPAGWGWVDVKSRVSCDSLEALTEAIRDDHDGSLALVWTPDHPRMMLAEELKGMGDALRTARSRWVREDMDDAGYKLRWFGTALVGFSLYSFYGGFQYAGRLAAQSGVVPDMGSKLAFATRAMLGSTSSGLALLMFVIFAFIPWYQARKRSKQLGRWTEKGIADAAPTIRFETWLAWQKAPLTKVFLILISLVALAQILVQFKSDGIGTFMHFGGTAAAGLQKQTYLEGDWWRLFTAPFLHGNIVHFLMNAAGLLYLGKRLEVFARWPHLPLVFLFSACIGGEASARFVDAPSVGASGGLMGWLGFLMVFETLHKQLVPLRARRRLAAGVLLTALIGVIGYRYIDNAAHAGGLLAGMIYGVIVFPSTASARRPRSTVTDRIAGGAAMVVLVASALLAAARVLAG